MLNKLWPIFIIFSFVYSFFSGKVGEVNNSIFESASSAVQLSITFLGTMCLWNGIMHIAYKTTLIEKLTKIISPVMKFLFPKLKKDGVVYKEISMNIVANMLGLGNAATPLGIRAMKSMQLENDKKDILSDSMAMFIVLNAASIQIIPTTVIALRNSLESADATEIIVPVWIATIFAAIAGIIVSKILMKKY